MSRLTAVSLFAGVEGFGLALERCGVPVVAAVEKDPDCRGVIARHFPRTALFEDVTEVTGEQLRAAGFDPGRGIVTAGWPCFAAGTRVLVERGWVPIEDVVAGDLALTHAGRWQPVTSVMSRVADHVIQLCGQGLPRLATTSEHPFYARAHKSEWVSRSPSRPNGSRRRVMAEPGWVEAAKMADLYAAQVLPPIEPAEHDAATWWLVGRFLADGWLSASNGKPRVQICAAHGEADHLAARIAEVGLHATRVEMLTVTRFAIHRRWFAELVSPLGRGAAAKTLTRRELALPPAEAESLLAGWLSGDGSRTQGRWKGTTVSRSLALSMALLAQRARGVVASLHETPVPATTVIAGREVGQRTQYQVVISDRNRSAFTEGAYGWKLVRSAKRTDGPVLVYNLSVAGDESYVADGAIVHNCQDISVAGRREGLGGARSGLFWQVVRLAGELRPRWLVLENVADLLSSVCSCPGNHACVRAGRAVACGRWEKRDGERVFVPHVMHTPPGGACRGGCMAVHGGAMGTVLGALGEIGYGFAYRVLDSRFFNVPQRRERVFIVGCLGGTGAEPVEVLLEPESGAGNPATGEAKRTDIAGTLGSRAGGSRTTDLDGHEAHVPAAIPIQDGRAMAKAQNGLGIGNERDPAYTVDTTGAQAVTTLQGGGRRGHRVDAEGAAGGHLIPFDTAQITSSGNRANPRPGDPAPTLNGAGQVHVAPFPSRDVIACDTSREGKGADSDATSGFIVQPVALRGRAGASQIETGEPGEPAFTVRTPGGGSSYPMIAHALTSEGADASEDGTGRGTPLVPMAFNPQTGGSEARLGYGETPTALQASQVTGVHQATAVRRLTPRECERLQAFPDDWTRYKLVNGILVEQSDSARYRQLGNAVTTSVPEWIIRRLVAVDEASR